MKDLVAIVRNQHLFAPGETVVVAVSGGADSVALLDIMTRLADERLKLIVAHLNHCLRGAESDTDEKFVADLATRYHLPFVAIRVDVASFAAAEGLSLEDAGRQARYAFFHEVARRRGATGIAVAHHLDDQAETVLIRLLRGAGATGLSAMKPSGANLVKRPLLKVSREELELYLNGRGLTWRTDETNSDTAILRNSIRHELIPVLKKYNPRVTERLAATAEILAADEELLDHLTVSSFDRLAFSANDEVVFGIEALLQEHRGLRLRLYRHGLHELRGDLMCIALTHLEAIDRLACSCRPNAGLKLPGDLRVERCYDRLSFTCAAPSAPRQWEQDVPGEGSYRLENGMTLTVRRVERPDDLATGSKRIVHLSADAAPFPWLVRPFTPGDRFTPLGMTGSQKVKELFINEKLPLHERSRVPLVFSEGEIVWVAGVRVAQKGRVTSTTGAVLRVEILDITP
ncbi:tRNA lysidine(34) synthetase TilS [Geomonas nitrogeniifigens]|uniref:tRNA(Ile)-lysidine synthase n=1 Tax=Geomonas diazotrophica TaxID=2843197 RepID=A0ABX8JQU0_9BACT|nr:tRNA lysidine(34) synthetase TilS [Geomonas nitrogeniifigens]QWV98994.1 tRNA lysidine(34) synthetase TilS [Geomonas nitrogeniifigens]QXE88160.1 tRNA lysidine(34) synthetase TilS [Geomonas nitrogeniifigens]